VTDGQIIKQQFEELASKFTKLHLEKGPDKLWHIWGLLGFAGEFSGQLIEDEFAILMIVPNDYPKNLPQVWETENRIPSDFHKYTNKSLCLGAPLAVKATFYEEPTLSCFVHNCLIPYLYSYSFYSRNGSLPFGELSHGIKGIYEYYRELFHLEEKRAVFRLIKILAGNNYRGHLPCPCGSGKKLRSCHGPLLLNIKELQSPVDFQGEYDVLSRNI
jgi:hypothetical protein